MFIPLAFLSLLFGASLIPAASPPFSARVYLSPGPLGPISGDILFLAYDGYVSVEYVFVNFVVARDDQGKRYEPQWTYQSTFTQCISNGS
jgi:hypothetical protein